MKYRRLVGLGAGGHAAVIIETLRAAGNSEIVGLLAPERGQVLGVPIIGDDDIIVSLQSRGIDGVFLAVGMMKSSQSRRRLVAQAMDAGLKVVEAIHPKAIIAPSVQMGVGTQVLAGAIIQSRARLGNHILINTGAIVEHDGQLGDFSHIATGAHLAGGVRVDEGVFIGAGAVVIQGITIGANAIVGAGSVVIHDVEPNTVVAGIPARVIKRTNIVHQSTQRSDAPQYALSSAKEFGS